MNNRAALFTCSIQCLSSTVMVTIFSMNPSIDASVSVISTARGSDFARCFDNCSFSSFGSKVLCDKLRLSISQDSSLSRCFLRSILAFLIVVYYAGVGMVPKGNLR